MVSLDTLAPSLRTSVLYGLVDEFWSLLYKNNFSTVFPL